MSIADDLERERAAFMTTVAEVGFDAPTGCEGWTVGDVVVHVVVGELLVGSPTTPFRALVGRGVRIDRMAPVNRRATRAWRQRRSPAWALARLSRPAPWLHRRGLVGAVSLLEVWAHHEDVLRAAGARCSSHIDLTPVVGVLLRYQQRTLARAGVRVVAGGLTGGSGPTTVEGRLDDVARWLAGRGDIDALTTTGPSPTGLRLSL